MVCLAAGLSLSGCGSSVSPGPAAAIEGVAFPTVEGTSLNNRSFQLPAGFDAPYNVLLVAFLREQQADVNTWLNAAADIAADHANVEYYELPTISSGWTIARGWIDNGMRSGVQAFAARERTITLYTDTARFRELLGIDGPGQIWIGLVDREGKVYWSTRGRATPETIAQLQREVRTLASPAAP